MIPLEEIRLLILADKSKTSENVAPLNQIKVLPFKEKSDWILEAKYNIGKKL